MSSIGSWLWVKAGDHRDEVAELCHRFVSEVGQRAGDVDVHGRIATTPQGVVFTLLVAEGTGGTSR